MIKRRIRAAAIQASPVFLDKKATIEKFCSLIEEAGREGAEFIVTPETGIPGYPYWRGSFGYTDPESAALWREAVIDYYEQSLHIERDTRPLCLAARSADAHCVIGCSEQDDRPGSRTLFNTMLFIGRDGRILGRHRKLIPTHQERIFWGMGDASDLRVFETDIGRIGGLVCFENHVTLFKAAMAIKGEEIHAANWPGYWTYAGERRNVRDMSGATGPYHLCDQDSAVREYAFETQTFVVSASLIQPPETVPDSFPFKARANFRWAIGGSSIVNPFGMYLVEPVLGEETIIYADLDLDDRTVAKNVFDCMGHYARWDVVSLNLREEEWGPLRSGEAGRLPISEDRLEEIARKHNIPPKTIEAILRECGA